MAPLTRRQLIRATYRRLHGRYPAASLLPALEAVYRAAKRSHGRNEPGIREAAAFTAATVNPRPRQLARVEQLRALAQEGKQ